jgi:hypothetical protein
MIISSNNHMKNVLCEGNQIFTGIKGMLVVTAGLFIPVYGSVPPS